MRKNEVAVLLPTYNRAEFLEKSIDSILTQTVPVDILVCDDGSDDPIVQNLIPRLYQEGIIAGFTRNDQNRGVAHARNVLMDMALMEGYQYMAWQDSDDLSHPQRIENQLRRIKETGAQVCFSNMYFFSGERPGRTKRIRVIDTSRYVSRESLYDNTNFATGLFTHNIAHTRFNESLRRREDIEWITKLIHTGISFTQCDEPLYYCRRHSGRLTYSKVTPGELV